MLADEDVKAPNIFERAKQEIEAVIHTGKVHHFHKETHGNRNDIDENTPLDDVILFCCFPTLTNMPSSN